jgi:hypothetical protein
MDTVLLVGDPVVEAVHGMADVTEAVPLRRRLGVPSTEVLVVTRFVLQPDDLVLEGSPTEQRRIGDPHVEVQREDGTPAYARCTARRAFRRKEVQTAEDVVVAPQPPRRTDRLPREEFLVRRKLCASHKESLRSIC